MAKYCEERYPMGTIPYQKTAGKHVDGFLLENIQIMARNIVRDMTFLTVIYSSTLEVGTGKSVFAQHYCEVFNEEMKKQHGIEVPFTEKNVVFRPEKLMQIAPKLPKYSAIILDEWDEKNYLDQLSVALRSFFRKCRQLNQFMVIIIPDYFQLPKGYAISRSVCAIDVKFVGEFQRGHFDFYSFNRKKELYIKGKKTYDYKTVRPNFYGRFPDGYAIGEKEYRKAKRMDMAEVDVKEQKNTSEVHIKAKVFAEMREKTERTFSIKQLAESFGVSTSTGERWLKKIKDGELVTKDEGVMHLGNLSEQDKGVNKGNLSEQNPLSFAPAPTIVEPVNTTPSNIKAIEKVQT